MHWIIKRALDRWKKNWPDYIIQLIVLVIFGYLITLGISNTIKPQTDISVSCKILKGVNANYSLEIYFDNKADFAGEDFYIYLWLITSNGWGTDYVVSEHCKRIEELDVDRTHRFKVYCNFIPPKTKFDFLIDTDLNNLTIENRTLDIEWWSKTTPYKHQIILCS